MPDAASDFTVETLLETPTVTVRDVYCRGRLRHRGDAERATLTQLVFPYRGTYVRHLGSDEAVAEANQVLLFNADEPYRVSHPVEGGDASLAVVVGEELIRDVAPCGLLRDRGSFAFRPQ